MCSERFHRHDADPGKPVELRLVESERCPGRSDDHDLELVPDRLSLEVPHHRADRLVRVGRENDRHLCGASIIALVVRELTHRVR